MTRQPTVASPCVDVCEIDAASGWCAGCMRTLDEIAAWSSLAAPAQRAVWKQLPVRRRQFEVNRPLPPSPGS